MKKSLLTMLCGTAALYAGAQNLYSDMAPTAGQGTNTGTERALFTIQHDTPPTDIAAQLAGCYWDGTQFWLSKWANGDSIFTANASGVMTSGFLIPGVTAVRSITSDGTNLYMSNNSMSIFKVDPVTKTVISTITSAGPDPSRWITYDPTLNTGAGGFWTGNYATNITPISMTGTVLSGSITAATHGLTGVYGLAYDPYSAGGPFFWAFDQGGNGSDLVKLSYAGVATGVIHDTQTDLAGGAAGLAGGVCIVNNYVANTSSIIGLSQGTSLFAYELTNSSSVNEQSPLQADVNVYPNPVVEQASVSFTLTSQQAVTIEVYTVQGTLVYASGAREYNQGKNTFILDASSMAAGLYNVKLTVNGYEVVKAISVTK